jgi:hypothetical protein
MCNFFSGYIDKLGNIYDGNGFTDEHSVIAKIHNLRDDEQAYYSQNLAKFDEAMERFFAMENNCR